MQRVVMHFTVEDARYIATVLRAKYNRTRRTGLATLCQIAVRQEVAVQSRKEAIEAEAEMDAAIEEQWEEDNAV